MSRRHGWTVDPATVFTTHGVVAGFAICLSAFTRPGDGVILFTPVYHAFHRVLRANDREIVESPLVLRDDGRYAMDLDALAARAHRARAHRRPLLAAQPRRPGLGRRARSARSPTSAARTTSCSSPTKSTTTSSSPAAATSRCRSPRRTCLDRLVMLTAATKTFNIAGTLTGNVIIPDEALRKRFAAAHLASGTSPNRFGALMATAAYAEGDAWVDALCRYLAGNAEILATGIAAIPGLSPMPLDATYLAWVDFSGTGMTPAEFTARVEKEARIAPSHGPTFGAGGEGYLRFNIGTPRARVAEAVRRLQAAFADLQ